jgi:ubiquinone/menaquinone biosynthesis C-methylase UbiE
MSQPKSPKPGGHVCPWWFAYSFDNVLRRLVHDPPAMIASYLGEGGTALDVGPGMGHFTIGMARIVGAAGKVHAVDLQQEMLDVIMKRAAKAGLAGRVEPRLCSRDSLALGKLDADFALVFWMAHEVPDPERLFREIHGALREGARLLYAEPSFHVKEELFRSIVAAAEQAGFILEEEPKVRFSRAALFRRE